MTMEQPGATDKADETSSTTSRTSSALAFSLSKSGSVRQRNLVSSTLNAFSASESKMEGVVSNAVVEVNKRDGIVHADKSAKEMPKKLVIPCRPNSIGVQSVKKEIKDEIMDEEDKEAVEALLNAKDGDNDDSNDEDTKEPLLIPSAKSIDTSKDGLVSTLDDYESVPVHGFGLGMLRGMGFDEKTLSINNKARVMCIEPQLRPKGLGLGATLPKQSDKKDGKKGTKELVMKKGAFVRLERGSKKNMYAVIEGIDDESSRLYVKLAIKDKKESSRVMSVSVHHVKLVDEHEYKMSSKVINEQEYQEAKKKAKTLENGDTWLKPNLRVRFVDAKFKNGIFFKHKMIVDRVNRDDQTGDLIDEQSDELIENVRQDQLETIVSTSTKIVRIVAGKYTDRGYDYAKVLERNRDKGTAWVRLQSNDDRNKDKKHKREVEVSLDHICEEVEQLDRPAKKKRRRS